MASAPLTIICTGTYWRNAWKCQARTYRHFGWDNGTLLANMLAVSPLRGCPPRLCSGSWTPRRTVCSISIRAVRSHCASYRSDTHPTET